MNATATATRTYRTRSAEVIARYGALATANYATADAKGKAGIRKAVADRFAESMRNGDLTAAPLWFNIQEGLKSAKATRATVEVNPLEIITSRVRQLVFGAIALANGMVTPEGLVIEASDEITEMSEALATIAERLAGACNSVTGFTYPATDDSDWIAGTKLASAKITRSTTRNSIEDVFARAFDGQAIGTVLTVTDIRNMGRTDEYTPSAGAIAARYRDGVCTVEGYEAVPATVDAPLSFRSV